MQKYNSKSGKEMEEETLISLQKMELLVYVGVFNSSSNKLYTGS